MDIAETVARAEDQRDDERIATKARAQAFDFDLEPKAAQLPAPITAQQLRPSGGVTPADLLRVAMEAGDKDIDRLERLSQMDLRYRELQDAERKEARMLAWRAAFVGLSGEGIVVPKTKHVDRGRAGSFEQAEFDEVKRRLSAPCARHGFGFRHNQKFGSKRVEGLEGDQPWVWVWCYLDHTQGHSEVIELEGPAGDLPANTVVQNQQATASYLKRVSLLAITGTATGGEDEEIKLVKQQKGADKTDRLDVMRDAGRAASLEGMKVLTDWWGSLTDKDRADLSKDFGGMRKAARLADEEAAK
ncbi:MAG: hypothetical protein EOP35_01670 [Rubrivivax sp.]|nr:MAG: hypothetical protein EOP35_01670 [Rubrivivax sp.]